MRTLSRRVTVSQRKKDLNPLTSEYLKDVPFRVHLDDFARGSAWGSVRRAKIRSLS